VEYQHSSEAMAGIHTVVISLIPIASSRTLIVDECCREGGEGNIAVNIINQITSTTMELFLESEGSWDHTPLALSASLC
jgi:hypothetical protein